MSRNHYMTAFDFGHALHVYKDEFTINDKGQRSYSAWRYDDNDVLQCDDTVKRACPKCNLMPTADDHDPCIANLHGVDFACCGHGKQDPYIVFAGGEVIRGDDEFDAAIEKIKVLGL